MISGVRRLFVQTVALRCVVFLGVRALNQQAAKAPALTTRLATAGGAVATTVKKARVLFCLGGPGAGKGTQCERMRDELGVVHLSAGDLLRRECEKPDSEDGALIASLIAEGKIVPVKLSLGLLRRAMEESEADRFIIDGFPRNFDNLDGWDEMMPDFADVDGVLFYDVPPAVMTERMLKRGETSGRSDDNLQAAAKRITTFHESTMPIIDYFEKQGKVLRVRGDQPVDDVWEMTKKAVEPFLEGGKQPKMAIEA